jgi:post-segregation antitoxin (ccd killing protein)
MSKYTVIHTIRFSEQQADSLQKLKDYDVNVSKFIRLAISEKIKRDWKQIKSEKQRVKLPF